MFFSLWRSVTLCDHSWDYISCIPTSGGPMTTNHPTALGSPSGKSIAPGARHSPGLGPEGDILIDVGEHIKKNMAWRRFNKTGLHIQLRSSSSVRKLGLEMIGMPRRSRGSNDYGDRILWYNMGISPTKSTNIWILVGVCQKEWWYNIVRPAGFIWDLLWFMSLWVRVSWGLEVVDHHKPSTNIYKPPARSVCTSINMSPPRIWHSTPINVIMVQVQGSTGHLTLSKIIHFQNKSSWIINGPLSYVK